MSAARPPRNATRPRASWERTIGYAGQVRVLVWSDEAYGAISGGHRVQIDRTAQALRRLDVDVRLATDEHVSLDGVDVVHSIGAPISWTRRARAARVPVVVSPIYWGQSYVFTQGLRQTAVRRAIVALKTGRSMFRRGLPATAMRILDLTLNQVKTIETADLMLPNSRQEAEAIWSELGVSTPAHVVPNGVDHRTFVLPVERARSGVLYAARVEPHKNQFGLIRALAGTGVPLTIVGAAHPHHLDYMRACRAEAGPTVRFLEEQSQEQLVILYQGAAVHAMPSMFETTGLSSLEASLCGAAVVSTSRGYVREYFGEDIEYCEPEDPASILSAVSRALAAGPSDQLRRRILSSYTWDHTAEATLEAYRLVMPVRATST